MRSLFLCIFAILCTNYAMAEAVPVSVVQQVEKAPEVVAPAPQAALPAPIKTVEEVQLSVKDEAFVPPMWLQDALLSLKTLPWIGPYAVKAFQWLGIIVSILTALFAFLWTLLRSMQLVMDAGKLYDLSNKLAALEKSKFMYYLKAFSAFNAQEKDKKS